MQAVKTAIYAAAVFSKLGYEVKPAPDQIRHDIIQAITLNSSKNLENFCVAIQVNSPVDAYVVPEPANIPGYQDKIIMAAGTFVQGASIELSADGPMREPYNVFMQGGLTFEHGQLAINAAARMIGPASKSKKLKGDVVIKNEKDPEIIASVEKIVKKYNLETEDI